MFISSKKCTRMYKLANMLILLFNVCVEIKLSSSDISWMAYYTVLIRNSSKGSAGRWTIVLREVREACGMLKWLSMTRASESLVRSYTRTWKTRITHYDEEWFPEQVTALPFKKRELNSSRHIKNLWFLNL